jgi:hypothetical protein
MDAGERPSGCSELEANPVPLRRCPGMRSALMDKQSIFSVFYPLLPQPPTESTSAIGAFESKT